MGYKKKYQVGDVFSLALDRDGHKGYGRILKIDHGLVFIELYRIISLLKDNSIDEIRNIKVLMSIWSTDYGLKKGLWTILGNNPIEGEVILPNFWTRDVLTNKIVLIKMGDSIDSPESRVEISEEEIGDAQPYGVFGDEAVIAKYSMELKNIGLL